MGNREFVLLFIVVTVVCYLFTITVQVGLLVNERLNLRREPSQTIFRGFCQCAGFLCALLGMIYRARELYAVALAFLALGLLLSLDKPPPLPDWAEKPLLLLMAFSISLMFIQLAPYR